MTSIIHDSRTGADDTKAVIVWDNLAGDWTATSELAAFPAINLAEESTDDLWLADNVTSADATIDFGSNKTVGAVFAYVVEGESIQVAYSTDDVTYTVIDSGATDDNTLFLFDDVTARYIRLRITAAAAADLGLAVAIIGEKLVMQRSVYQGLTPTNLARDSQIRPQISESGNWLGSTIQRRGFSPPITWSNLKAQWYRDNFEPFAKDRIGKPFVIAWRPESGKPSENDVLYAISPSDVVPENSGPRDYMSVTLEMRGFGGG